MSGGGSNEKEEYTQGGKIAPSAEAEEGCGRKPGCLTVPKSIGVPVSDLEVLASYKPSMNHETLGSQRRAIAMQPRTFSGDREADTIGASNPKHVTRSAQASRASTTRW